MTIRFLPLWIGSTFGVTIGQFVYALFKALVHGAGRDVPWLYQSLAAFCIGFITACLYAVVMAAVETKRHGAAKVKLW